MDQNISESLDNRVVQNDEIMKLGTLCGRPLSTPHAMGAMRSEHASSKYEPRQMLDLWSLKLEKKAKLVNGEDKEDRSSFDVPRMG